MDAIFFSTGINSVTTLVMEEIWPPGREKPALWSTSDHHPGIDLSREWPMTLPWDRPLTSPLGLTFPWKRPITLPWDPPLASPLGLTFLGNNLWPCPWIDLPQERPMTLPCDWLLTSPMGLTFLGDYLWPCPGIYLWPLYWDWPWPGTTLLAWERPLLGTTSRIDLDQEQPCSPVNNHAP